MNINLSGYLKRARARRLGLPRPEAILAYMLNTKGESSVTESDDVMFGQVSLNEARKCDWCALEAWTAGIHVAPLIRPDGSPFSCTVAQRPDHCMFVLCDAGHETRIALHPPLERVEWQHNRPALHPDRTSCVIVRQNRCIRARWRNFHETAALTPQHLVY
jgi:hypothetical protein